MNNDERNLLQDPAMMEFAIAAVRYYAETHPRPSTVNQGEAAEMLGISGGTMSKLVKFGTFKLNESGRIPIHQIDLQLTVTGKVTA